MAFFQPEPRARWEPTPPPTDITHQYPPDQQYTTNARPLPTNLDYQKDSVKSWQSSYDGAAYNLPTVIFPDGTTSRGFLPLTPPYQYNPNSQIAGDYKLNYPARVKPHAGIAPRPDGHHRFQRRCSKCGILLGVLLFPIGLICAFSMYEQTCTRCGGEIAPDDDAHWNVHRDQQTGKVNHNANPGVFDGYLCGAKSDLH